MVSFCFMCQKNLWRNSRCDSFRACSLTIVHRLRPFEIFIPNAIIKSDILNNLLINDGSSAAISNEAACQRKKNSRFIFNAPCEPEQLISAVQHTFIVNQTTFRIEENERLFIERRRKSNLLNKHRHLKFTNGRYLRRVEKEKLNKS